MIAETKSGGVVAPPEPPAANLEQLEAKVVQLEEALHAKQTTGARVAPWLLVCSILGLVIASLSVGITVAMHIHGQNQVIVDGQMEKAVDRCNIQVLSAALGRANNELSAKSNEHSMMREQMSSAIQSRDRALQALAVTQAQVASMQRDITKLRSELQITYQRGKAEAVSQATCCCRAMCTSNRSSPDRLLSNANVDPQCQPAGVNSSSKTVEYTRPQRHKTWLKSTKAR